MPEKPLVPIPPQLIGNSHKGKESQQRQPLKPVAQAKVKRKGFGGWFTDVFLGDSLANLGNYILVYVLIPSIKDFLLDSVSVMLGGSPKKANSVPKNGIVNYNGFSQNRRAAIQTTEAKASKPGIDDVILQDKRSVENVISQLCDIIDQYDAATLSQFYELVGLQQYSEFTDEKYGWTNLSGAIPVKVRGGGWGFSMPPVIALD